MLGALPSFITMYMTFSTSKSIAVDFIKYIGKLVCMMTNYKTYIRVFFYIIVILEIIQYMQKKFKFITCALLFLLLMYDIRSDLINMLLRSNNCFE